MDLFSEFDREVAMGAQGAIIGCPYLVNWEKKMKGAGVATGGKKKITCQKKIILIWLHGSLVCPCWVERIPRKHNKCHLLSRFVPGVWVEWIRERMWFGTRRVNVYSKSIGWREKRDSLDVNDHILKSFSGRVNRFTSCLGITSTHLGFFLSCRNSVVSQFMNSLTASQNVVYPTSFPIPSRWILTLKKLPVADAVAWHVGELSTLRLLKEKKFWRHKKWKRKEKREISSTCDLAWCSDATKSKNVAY